MALTVFQIHLAATWFMVGLIWFVQVVHYPQFDGVGTAGFAVYHRRHTQRTTWVVLPVMLVELASGISLCIARPASMPYWVPWAGLLLLVVTWSVTFLISVPRHNELVSGFSEASHRSLCRTNWIRTIAWTARGILLSAVAMLAA